jgi:hypothetical protein
VILRSPLIEEMPSEDLLPEARKSHRAVANGSSSVEQGSASAPDFAPSYHGLTRSTMMALQNTLLDQGEHQEVGEEYDS